ncbi:hypothetical protein GGX14DRAFT_453823 [Mycena pura]|uniref:Uncharacterized protein n=1 Tax=Mycena pura TaxID=153505 RepID=A0AAD6VBS1_9AGAR|nr:hypothetical protein GGX14DRAFT_453823 [Mycena pura]
MLSSFLCCFPHSQRAPNNDSPIIPDENTHLIPAGVNTMTPEVDGRIFRDRLGAIVRSTESKMVNVGARMPFCVTFQSETAHARLLPHSSPAMSTPAASGSAPLTRRRLPVLTMTPASACNMHSSSASSVSSSRARSRTSSPRKPLLAGAVSQTAAAGRTSIRIALVDESAAGVACASESDGAANGSVGLQSPTTYPTGMPLTMMDLVGMMPVASLLPPRWPLSVLGTGRKSPRAARTRARAQT